VPIVFRRFLDALAEENPGIVHQNGELAIETLGGLHCSAPIGFAGDVQVDVGRLAASGPDVRFGRLAFRVQDIAKDYLRPFTAKHPCSPGALPAGATTDEGYLPIKSSHAILLPVLSFQLSNATHR